MHTPPGVPKSIFDSSFVHRVSCDCVLLENTWNLPNIQIQIIESMFTPVISYFRSFFFEKRKKNQFQTFHFVWLDGWFAFAQLQLLPCLSEFGLLHGCSVCSVVSWAAVALLLLLLLLLWSIRSVNGTACSCVDLVWIKCSIRLKPGKGDYSVKMCASMYVYATMRVRVHCSLFAVTVSMFVL